MRRDVFLLSLAAFASAASLRATDPLLPLIAADYGITPAAAAGAVTSFTLAYGLLQIVCGPLGDRFGRYATIAAAALVAALGSLACALAPDLDRLVVARFVTGGVVGAFIPLSLAWIGDSFPYEARQPVLARFLIGQMGGLACGTALAGWLGEHFGWRAIFFVLAALLLLIGGLLGLELARNPATRAPAGARASLRESLARLPRLVARSDVRALIITGFCEGMLVFGPFAFVALFLQRSFGVGPGVAGTLIAVYAAGGLLYAVSAKRAVQRLGESGLAAAGGAALVLGYLGLTAAPSAALATLFIGAVGGGFYMLHTTIQARVTQVAPEQRGSTVALFATFLFMGQASGVWLASRVIESAGTRPVFACAALGLGLLAFFFRRLLAARRVP